MRKIELLAPAQNKECAYDAINYGADSVYIGATSFGARQNAKNSIEDIKTIVEYAHKFGVKIYVTINTILTDDELLQAREIIVKLDKIGVDGIIIQDMGLLKLDLPPVKLIASTQCDIRNLEKVKFFEELGIKRVILARELSLEKIKEICSNSKVEVETFVHGALCVSYSGQCYLSYNNGGRSANRGECAQSCRKKYTLVDDNGKILAKDKYLLSLKDFCAINRLEELIDAGVTSFKIEGRLKDSNYVKNAVSSYRKALDKIIKKRNDIERASLGESKIDFETNLEKSFNRGMCEYFLGGKRGKQGLTGKAGEIFNFDTPKSMGEFVGKADGGNKKSFILNCKEGVEIKPQDGLCFIRDGNLAGLLVNSLTKINENTFEIFPNLVNALKMPKNGVKIYRNKDAAFDAMLKKSNIKRKIGVKFRVKDGEIEAFNPDKTSASIKFETKEEAKNLDFARENWGKAFRKTDDTIFKFEEISFESKIYFLPMSKMNELRREILKLLEEKRLNNYIREKQGEIKKAKYPLKAGDYRLNAHNKKAKEFYEESGCRVYEMSLESGNSSKGKELMRTKHCLRYAFNMCFKEKGKNCKLFLIDEKGAKFPLDFDCANCEMILLSNVTK